MINLRDHLKHIAAFHQSLSKPALSTSCSQSHITLFSCPWYEDQAPDFRLWLQQRLSIWHHDDSSQANMGPCKGWRGARWPENICTQPDDIRQGSNFPYQTEV
jgi:hypothetical protein